MFTSDSRYYAVDTADLIDERHRKIVYKKTRIIPDRRPRYAHKVRASERLDHIAFRYFKAPDKFWLICDVNLTMWPEELVGEKGRIILIPEPER